MSQLRRVKISSTERTAASRARACNRASPSTRLSKPAHGRNSVMWPNVADRCPPAKLIRAMEAALTREAPYPRRLSAYLSERFPLLGHGLLIAAYYSSNQFLA